MIGCDCVSSPVVVKPKMQACVDVMCKTILSGAAKVGHTQTG